MASAGSAQNVIRRKLVIIGDGACGKTSLLSVFTLGYFPTIPTVFENYVTDCRVDGKSVQLALWDTAGQEDYERLRPLAYSKAHVILIGFSVDTPDSLDNVKHKVGTFAPRAPAHKEEIGTQGSCDGLFPLPRPYVVLFLALSTSDTKFRSVHTPATFKIIAETDKAGVEQWVEEATEKCPGVPIILVGLKKDLREDPVAVEEMRKKSLRFVTEHDGEAAAREAGAKKYLECSSLSGEGVDDVFEAATRAALLTFEKGEGGGCCVIL
ncbi:hypothetical protein diail_5185 [Diaporthe ilicicola]|nr:hypothetical protein diail_5185 [Diaporthe ilicicola]